MNGFDTPDTFAALASMCSLTGDDKDKYGGSLQEMLENSAPDEDGCTGAAEKKRRLSLHQVQALELSFEVENKLEPERKNKLAKDLGLQPRQVAVWFQNRRARCKTKKLERDNALLRATNDALGCEIESLKAELRELKKGRRMDAGGENAESEQSIVTAEAAGLPLESENDAAVRGGARGEHCRPCRNGDVPGLNCRFDNRPSDSDSCGGLVMKQESNVGAAHQQQLRMISSPSSGTGAGTASCSSSPSSSRIGSNGSDSLAATPTPASWFMPQFGRMEEHEQGLYSSEDSCNFFLEDQAPTLHWY